MKECPECGGMIEIDCTPEINQEKPYERVCYECGWFDMTRYITREGAEQAQ